MTDRTEAEILAGWLERLAVEDVPAACRGIASNLLLDSAGLAVAARRTDYMAAMVRAFDASGPCSVIGQAGGHDAAGAAVLNGTAIHGEDFDDSFEGAPLHAGAASIPALLAVCESHGLAGADFYRGLIAALEVQSRLALVAPGAIHAAGFQPASVIGCVGAAAGTAVALGLDRTDIVNALGLSASLSSGLMEFLAEGAWTKRLHPGWAAQAGYRATMMARQGVIGPRTVFEGANGFFRAFAPSAEPDFSQLSGELGSAWRMQGIIFKLYPCGTPIGPYIDCAIRLAERGIAAADIETITCKVAEPVIRRQWSPIEDKRRPANAFAAKFSGPFGVALGFVRGRAGLGEYSPETLADPAVADLAQKVSCEVDEASEFPANYTGHLRARLTSGDVVEIVQPHLRGGLREPVGREELERKFRGNVRHGGWSDALADRLQEFCETAFDRPDLSELAAFRT